MVIEDDEKEDEFEACKKAFIRDFRDIIDHFERCWLEMDEKEDAANTSWRPLLELLYKEKLNPEAKEKLDSMARAFILQFQAERVVLRKQVIDMNRDILAKFEIARTPQEFLQAAEEIGKQIVGGWQ